MKFLSLNLPLVGVVQEDKSISEAGKKYQSVVDAFPSATASSNFRGLAKTVATELRDTHTTQNHQFFSDRLAFN